MQLNCWRLWAMVVILFSCNVDVVVWRGKPCLPVLLSWVEVSTLILSGPLLFQWFGPALSTILLHIFLLECSLLSLLRTLQGLLLKRKCVCAQTVWLRSSGASPVFFFNIVFILSELTNSILFYHLSIVSCSLVLSIFTWKTYISVSVDFLVIRQDFSMTLFVTSLLSFITHSKNVDIQDNLRKISWFLWR